MHPWAQEPAAPGAPRRVSPGCQSPRPGTTLGQGSGAHQAGGQLLDRLDGGAPRERAHHRSQQLAAAEGADTSGERVDGGHHVLEPRLSPGRGGRAERRARQWAESGYPGAGVRAQGQARGTRPPLLSQGVERTALILARAGDQGGSLSGPVPALPPCCQLGLDLAAPRGEMDPHRRVDALELGYAIANRPPLEAQSPGQLQAQATLVQVPGSPGVGVQAAAVEGAPATVVTPSQVGHQQVGMEMRIGGAAGPVHEAGGHQAVDAQAPALPPGPADHGCRLPLEVGQGVGHGRLVPGSYLDTHRILGQAEDHRHRLRGRQGQVEADDLDPVLSRIETRLGAGMPAAQHGIQLARAHHPGQAQGRRSGAEPGAVGFEGARAVVFPARRHALQVVGLTTVVELGYPHPFMIFHTHPDGLHRASAPRTSCLRLRSVLPAGRPPCYGLDIETDTATGGLDPAVTRVLAVAVAGPEGEVVFAGPEAGLLRALDASLSAAPAGVVVTWNGAAFDLPFLADRARRAGVVLGLELVLDPSIVRHRAPLAGHLGAYRATWHAHRHLDAYRAYRGLSAGTELSCGLKAVARRAGLAPVEVDASAVHRLSRSALTRYVASDASLARVLAESRWAEMVPHLDPAAPPIVDRPGPH